MGIIYIPRGRAQEYSLLALNHYRGCGHRCSYCYAADMACAFGQGPFNHPAAKPAALQAVEREAPRYACTPKRVLLSFMCDPYQPIDKDLQLTRQVIQILKSHKIPIQILTKGGLAAVRDFDLYSDSDAFASTLTFIDQARSKEWEPGAAPPSERIEAIKEAHRLGIETWVSLEPVIDADESLAIIDQTHEFVDLYKIGKLNHRKSDIDWHKWAINALSLCQRYGKKYYIKNDLARDLRDVKFENTDTRIIDISQTR